MLNRIVLIVHHGIIRPLDGARMLHGCASILGMDLIQNLPNTTVLIQGLVKSNDLARGHHFLTKGFAPFGDIVDASISPNNRGFGMYENIVHINSFLIFENALTNSNSIPFFVIALKGFVRFVTTDSVEKVLDKYRTSEIVIQDVAVTATTLKN